MKSLNIATVALILAAGSAQGALFFESEPNDTLATANDLGIYSPPGDGIVVDGMMVAGDVDWFSFTITDDAIFAAAAAYDIFGSGGDGQLQLVDAATGIVIAFDDDSNFGLMPSFQVFGLTAGTYYLGISGFPDSSLASIGTTDIFDGLDSSGAPHGEVFEYKITIGINLIPTPASAALLGLGGLVAIRRRR